MRSLIFARDLKSQVLTFYFPYRRVCNKSRACIYFFYYYRCRILFKCLLNISSMFDEFLRLLFKSLFFLSHSTITNSTILRIVFKKQTHTTSIEYWLNCTCTTSKIISCECPAPSICFGKFCTVFGLLYVILILRSNAVNYQCF